MTNVMIGSTTFGALGIHARRILDFLMIEHIAHAGRENGRLAATYRQLERFGLTKADIRKGFAELELAGFVRLTEQGMRQAGGGAPSRYALTWLPTFVGTPDVRPATNEWRAVLAKICGEGVHDVRGARKWLKRAMDRPLRSQKTQPHSGDIEGAPHEMAERRLQMRGDKAATVVPFAPQVRRGGMRK
jgi:hypothetical protein